MPGEVDRVNRERVRELRDDELEVVELRAHRVHQEQGWAAADAQVADSATAAQHDVANLPVRAPGPVYSCAASSWPRIVVALPERCEDAIIS